MHGHGFLPDQTISLKKYFGMMRQEKWWDIELSYEVVNLTEV